MDDHKKLHLSSDQTGVENGTAWKMILTHTLKGK